MLDSSRPQVEQTAAPPGGVDAADRPRIRIWELAGGVPGEPDYWSADRFAKIDGRPGVIMTRIIPEAELARLLTEHPERMHFTSNSLPPRASHLRLLP